MYVPKVTWVHAIVYGNEFLMYFFNDNWILVMCFRQPCSVDQVNHASRVRNHNDTNFRRSKFGEVGSFVGDASSITMVLKTVNTISLSVC